MVGHSCILFTTLLVSFTMSNRPGSGLRPAGIATVEKVNFTFVNPPLPFSYSPTSVQFAADTFVRPYTCSDCYYPCYPTLILPLTVITSMTMSVMMTVIVTGSVVSVCRITFFIIGALHTIAYISFCLLYGKNFHRPPCMRMSTG